MAKNSNELAASLYERLTVPFPNRRVTLIASGKIECAQTPWRRDFAQFFARYRGHLRVINVNRRRG